MTLNGTLNWEMMTNHLFRDKPYGSTTVLLFLFLRFRSDKWECCAYHLTDEIIWGMAQSYCG